MIFFKGGGTITGMISLLSEFDSELVGVAVFAENAKGDRDIHEYKSLLTVSDIDVKAQKVEVEVGKYFLININLHSIPNLTIRNFSF